MIDSLPLDLFGEDDAPSATIEAPLTCQWCETQAPAGTERCPACDARLFATPLPSPLRHQASTCQWCSTAIDPDHDTCPACGWDAHGDSQIEMPGITVPFSETQVRSLYGDDDVEQPTDAIRLAVNVIDMLLGGN